MSRHTPGPWKFVADEFNSHGGRNQLGSIQSRKWFIAVIEGDAGEDANECMANARLIVAAPDMREKIEDTLKEWDILPRDRPFTLAEVTDWLTRYMAPAMDGLRAAIAKAEGKS